MLNLTFPSLFASCYFSLRLLFRITCRKKKIDEDLTNENGIEIAENHQILKTKQRATSIFHFSVRKREKIASND